MPSSVGTDVIPQGFDQVIPQVLAIFILVAVRVPGGDDCSGPFVRVVAGAVHEDLVAVVDEPVQEGFGDDGVGEQRVPEYITEMLPLGQR